jgi:ADP-ribose pyrophosphatase
MASETEYRSAPKQVLFEGKHLRLLKIGHWEYVERPNASGIVGIVAITDQRRLVLVEQYRPPVGKNVIEIPAGLAGDLAGQENEDLSVAARRELFEETGYEAEKMVFVGEGVSSAGLCNEVISLFKAVGLKKTGAGTGDPTECIIVHEIPVDRVRSWLDEQRAAGKLVDLKIYSALYFADAE